jgi:GAF domain-containing protein
VRAPRISAETLGDVLARLRDLQTDLALDALLARVVDGVAEVFDVTGCGLMLLDEHDALRYVAASDEPARVLETAQEQLGHGPCVDSLVYGDLVVADDLRNDGRWPGLADLVVHHGVRAVLGIPVLVGATAVGSLNVYCNAPRNWDDSEIAALRAFNQFVEVVIGTAVLAHQRDRVALQLQEALDHRVTIERAVGYVMARDRVDAVTAFDRLRRVARSERRKVIDVAADLLSRDRN